MIAGHHRFEAARNCSHQTIRAEVYDSLSDDEAELIQIDENLIRANLSDAERILHVARRKQLYEKLHPETKHGGDRRSAGARSSSQNENLKAFVADIAVKTGKGRSEATRLVGNFFRSKLERAEFWLEFAHCSLPGLGSGSGHFGIIALSRTSGSMRRARRRARTSSTVA